MPGAAWPRYHYLTGDFADPTTYEGLTAHLAERERATGPIPTPCSTWR